MKTFAWMCGVVLILLVAGCVPERVVWSPDGKKAAVLGEDGLHVCDEAGVLSPLLVPHVRAVQWMPDSRRVVVIQHIDSAEELQALDRMLHEEDRGEVQSALRSNQLKHPGAESKEVDVCLSYELTATGVKAGPLMLITMGETQREIRLSPTGKIAAISCLKEDSAEASFLILSKTDFGMDDDVQGLGEAAQYPDWSPDGRYLVYVKPTGANAPAEAASTQMDAASTRPNRIGDMHFDNDHKETRLGVLVRRQVADEKGNLLKRKQMPSDEELVGVAYDPWLRIRVAADGRIFFSAAEVTLPATAEDMALRVGLFSFHPGKQATVTRVVPRGEVDNVGDMLQLFELCPDGRHLSVPYKDGRVMVLDIAGGTEQVQTAVEGGGRTASVTGSGSFDLKLASTPTWRNGNELTFVRPREDGKGSEVVRYSVKEKKATVISGSWPTAVTEGWLTEKKEPATQAATQTGATRPAGK